MSLIKLILKAAVPTPRLEDYQRFLFVGPHPDDIEIGAGATAAKLAAMGKDICFLVCTDGRFGDGSAPEGIRGADLVTLRKQEAIASAAMLGVTDVRFLELSDGGFYEQQELMEKIAHIVGDFQPDVILAPDPDVTSECHLDHLNVGNAVKRMAYIAPYAGIMAGFGANAAPVQVLAFFMTAKPNRFVKTGKFLQLQLKSVFDCHLSQFPKGSADAKSIALYLNLRSIDFGLRSGKGRAEGFRVLGVTQMHCFPEAGN